MADPWADFKPAKPVAADPFAGFRPAASGSQGQLRQRPRAASPGLPQGRYGSEIEREARDIDPALRVTGRERSAARNRQVGGVPNSAHLTDNARDFGVGPGETLEQARERLAKAFGPKGYKVLLEGAGAAHSTAPHLHVEATPAAQDFADPFAGFQEPAKTKAAPASHDAFAGFKPAPKPAPAKAPDTSYHGPGLVRRAATAIGDYAGQVVDDLTPKQSRRDAAQRDAAADYRKGGVLGLYEGQGKRAWEHNAGASSRALYSDFKDPLDKTKGWVALPARTGKTVMDAMGYVTSPLSAAAEAVIGPVAQRGLGVDPSQAAQVALLAAGKFGGREIKSPIRSLTSPEFADAASRRAAPVITRARSVADLKKNQLIARVQPLYQKLAGMGTDQYRDVVRAVKGTTPKVALTPEQTAVAKELRSVLDKAGGDLHDSTGVPLREGYFPQDWKPQRQTGTLGVRPPKVGSGRQLKAQELDFEDAIAKGMREKHANPLDATTHYLEDVYNRIGHTNALAAMQKNGVAKFVPANAMPKGWVALKGPGTGREAIPITDKRGFYTGSLGRKVLAAPEGAARLHNNMLERSIADTAAGPLYKVARAATNFGRASVLAAASPAHTVLTMGKAFGSEVARGANEILRGKVAQGAATLAKSPAAPFALTKRGFEMQRDLLTKGPQTEVEKLLVNGGMRVKEQGSYEANLHPSWIDSAARNTFRDDLRRDFGGIRDAQGLGKVSQVADAFGRAVKSINEPVFKFQVPAIKRGVAEAELSDFLRNNPKATEAEKLAESRRVLRSVDSRFGEVSRSNNFWHTWYNEASRLFLLSPSWVQGNARLYKDAASDTPAAIRSLVKGKGMTGDAAAMFGVAASRALTAGMLTAAMTGEMPKGMDWVAPRTGGKNPDGSAERMQVLSSMKDLDQLILSGDPVAEAYGKLNPAAQTAAELAQNKDYFNRDIYLPHGATDTRPATEQHSRLGDMAGYAADRMSPMGLQPRKENPQSHLAAWTNFLGVRPAGEKFSNPEKKAAQDNKYGTRAFKAAWKSRRREQGY